MARIRSAFSLNSPAAASRAFFCRSSSPRFWNRPARARAPGRSSFSRRATVSPMAFSRALQPSSRRVRAGSTSSARVPAGRVEGLGTAASASTPCSTREAASRSIRRPRSPSCCSNSRRCCWRRLVNASYCPVPKMRRNRAVLSRLGASSSSLNSPWASITILRNWSQSMPSSCCTTSPVSVTESSTRPSGRVRTTLCWRVLVPPFFLASCWTGRRRMWYSFPSREKRSATKHSRSGAALWQRKFSLCRAVPLALP